MRTAVIVLLIGTVWADFLPNGCPRDSNVHLFLKHETDCTKFYSCSNGNPILMSCGSGTAFDATLQVCIWKNQVDCSMTTKITTTTTSTTPVTTPSTTTLSSSTSPPTTTTLPPPTSSPITTTNSTAASTSTTTELTTTTTTTETPITTAPPSTCPYRVKLELSEDIDCDKFKHCTDKIKLILNCPIKGDNVNFSLNVNYVNSKKDSY